MTTNSPARKKRSLPARIGIWVGVVLLVIILALVITPFLFKDKLVQLAKDEANKQLDAQVDFGDFDLSLFSSFPDFRFEIENVSVVGKNQFAGDTLLAVKELSLDLNLMSVIRGDEYKVNALRLENPRIHAQVLRDGKANWDIVKSSDDSTAVDTAASEPTKFKLKLSSLVINDAYLIYDDQPGGMYVQVDDLDYELK
eukprot:gene10358-12698_t